MHELTLVPLMVRARILACGSRVVADPRVWLFVLSLCGQLAILAVEETRRSVSQMHENLTKPCCFVHTMHVSYRTANKRKYPLKSFINYCSYAFGGFLAGG